MENTFMKNLTAATNYGYTENGAVKHNTTLSAVYDMFALGAAMRNRSDEDIITMFSNALAEDEAYAMKCLFWIGDVRGGAGERRFFKVCMNYLAKNHTRIAMRNLDKIPEFTRWDNLYCVFGTALQNKALQIMRDQFELDMKCKTPSLLGKWLKSENTSSEESRRLANITRQYFGLTHKEYRKALSSLRERIGVLERLMSAKRWDEIEFDKIPSKTGIVYRNAFARNDFLKERYIAFMDKADTKVNAGTLYPYEIVDKALHYEGRTERNAVNKYWENQIDYLNGKSSKMICVCDTSGSMCGPKANAPINIAIGLSMYCAERLNGPFKNHYISFSAHPQLINIEGNDFCSRVKHIYDTNLCQNTNLQGVFDLLKSVALNPTTKKEDIPDTIVVISDMEIDYMTCTDSGTFWDRHRGWTSATAETEMEKIRKDWAANGLTMPHLVYWNVDARNNTILDGGPNTSYVSGASPAIFKSVLTGKSGMDLMYEALDGERYASIY